MANPTETSSYDKWRPREDWNSPIILYSPYKLVDIELQVQTNGADIGIGDIIELIQVIGNETDLYDATLAGDNSTVPMAIVTQSEANKEQLAKDNSLDSVDSLTKSTARFADNSPIDVVLLLPGIIYATKVIDSVGAAGYKIGSAVQCAGTNRIDVYATAQARLGYLLTQVYNVASLQWVAVLSQRGY